MSNPTPLTDDHVKNVCKPGTTEACAFLSSSGLDLCCAKRSFLESNIRQRLAKGTMRAIGDNCSGPPDFK
ncbi:MAG: hypothetical protein MRY49_01215 [Candidatus Pacebacteria bacterium]|nr:hypothetical protein [Candidatus Paceibacterota bacterium]